MESKGFLNYVQAKKFFTMVLNTDLKNKKNFKALIELLKENEVSDFDHVGFKKIAEIFLQNEGYLRFMTIK